MDFTRPEYSDLVNAGTILLHKGDKPIKESTANQYTMNIHRVYRIMYPEGEPEGEYVVNLLSDSIRLRRALDTKNPVDGRDIIPLHGKSSYGSSILRYVDAMREQIPDFDTTYNDTIAMLRDYVKINKRVAKEVRAYQVATPEQIQKHFVSADTLTRVVTDLKARAEAEGASIDDKLAHVVMSIYGMYAPIRNAELMQIVIDNGDADQYLTYNVLNLENGEYHTTPEATKEKKERTSVWNKELCSIIKTYRDSCDVQTNFLVCQWADEDMDTRISHYTKWLVKLFTANGLPKGFGIRDLRQSIASIHHVTTDI